jgi:azurin
VYLGYAAHDGSRQENEYTKKDDQAQIIARTDFIGNGEATESVRIANGIRGLIFG